MRTIEQITADFIAANISSPYSPDYRSAREWELANPGQRVNYDEHAEYIVRGIDVSDAPEGWKLAVHKALSDRVLEKSRREVAEEVALINPPEVRALILARRKSDLYHPKREDLRNLVHLAKQDRRRPVDIRSGERILIGKPPYTPKPGCNLRLRLKDAIKFTYDQAAYANMHHYAVPVALIDAAQPVDKETCTTNLRNFAAALRTHTGLAGSGDEWSAELHELPEGLVVELICRESIPD